MYRTHRLIIRPLTDSDAPQLSALRSLPEVNRFIKRAQTMSVDQALEAIQRQNEGMRNARLEYYALSSFGSHANLEQLDEHTTPHFIGTICLFNYRDVESKQLRQELKESEDTLSVLPLREAEIGYELHPDWQGKGLMREALEWLVQQATTRRGFDYLCAYTHVENGASIALLERLGFSLQAERLDASNENNRVYQRKAQKLK